MAESGPPSPASGDEFQRIWSIIQELGLAERHFNELESRYRALASTWMLAAFAGIGYIVVHRQLGVDVDVWVIIAIIALAGGLGILLLWNLDLLVYHQLLDVNFEEAKRLEEIYPWLPRTRTRMSEMMPGPGVLRRVVLFYIGGVDALVAMAGFALAMWSSVKSIPAAAGIGVLTTAALGAIDWWMWVKTRSEIRVPSPATSLWRRIMHLLGRQGRP
jgi:hypothetical protein